jgi:hypothetical protein
MMVKPEPTMPAPPIPGVAPVPPLPPWTVTPPLMVTDVPVSSRISSP